MRRTGSFILTTATASTASVAVALLLVVVVLSGLELELSAAQETETQQCTLYMAPTSTRIRSNRSRSRSRKNKKTKNQNDNDNIKLSMYAGVDIYNGTVIGRPEIIIPIIHPNQHYYYRKLLQSESKSKLSSSRTRSTKRRDPLQINDNQNPNESESEKPQFLKELIDFTWTPYTTSSQFEVGRKVSSSSTSGEDGEPDMMVYIPGVGALGNQHRTLVFNAEWDFDAYADGDAHYGGEGGDAAKANSRSSNVAHPGRGAHSQYNQISLVARANIPAGMEILVDDLGSPKDEDNEDGEDDDDDDDDDDFYNGKFDNLTPSDFQRADQSLTQIYTFFQKHKSHIMEKYGKNKIHSLYKYLIDDVIGYGDDIHVLIPDGVEELQDIVEAGTFRSTFPEMTRDVSWLKENGQCLDGIYSKRLDLDDGTEGTKGTKERGAFATRFVKEGDFIAPVPLMLIPDKSYLDMYELNGHQRRSNSRSRNNGENDGHDKIDDVVSSQLIVNYSFGHEESSLLFYPYGMNVNFINHRPTSTSSTSSTRDEKSETANAKLVWTDAKYHRPELLALTPDKLKLMEGGESKKVFYGLGMDLVATRDIEPNEEIFIDYGPQWEKKWEEHVQKWNTNHGNKVWDTKALDLNSAMNKNYFYTRDEIESLKKANKYDIPDTVMTVGYLELEDANELPSPDSNKKNSGETWFEFDKTTERSGHALKLCVVVDRYSSGGDSDDGVVDGGENSVGYEYTVELYDTLRGTKEFVKHVPQKYIQYVDKPYTSDIHTKDAFRHYIAIPDEIFPEAWRDLKS